MFTNIMLDLETLDTTPSAVVTAIGAVAFDPYRSGPEAMGKKFYVELTDDLPAQHRAGRTISPDTVLWWMRQGQAAQRLFQPCINGGVDRTTTIYGLHAFSNFVFSNGDNKARIWGNGTDFDNIILGSLYEDMGLKKPWSFGQNRCFRTLKNFPNAPDLQVRTGVHHNALDDAVTQAEHLQQIFAWLYPENKL